ncbi:MAG: TetR/AcrR family transcriptional regulator [Solirubrobacteraceae bacterium]|nr:TetR/AcrR family transcriptional regulator [Solirubrobacteraceae bacterium]
MPPREPTTDAAASSRRSRSRARIRDAMLPVIEAELRRGLAYSDIAIRTLTEQGDVPRSTFYLNFADKTDLLRACADHVLTETTGWAAAWWELGEDITREALHDALARAMARYLPRAPLMAAVYDGARYDDTLRDAVERITGELVGRVEEHLVRGQAGGWVDPTLLPHEAASWIMWMYERTQHQEMRHADDATIDRLVDAGTHLLWRTLYAPARRA